MATGWSGESKRHSIAKKYGSASSSDSTVSTTKLNSIAQMRSEAIQSLLGDRFTIFADDKNAFHAETTEDVNSPFAKGGFLHVSVDDFNINNPTDFYDKFQVVRGLRSTDSLFVVSVYFDKEVSDKEWIDPSIVGAWGFKSKLAACEFANSLTHNLDLGESLTASAEAAEKSSSSKLTYTAEYENIVRSNKALLKVK